jgi:Spy/CpxP family protein refolding chaperone
MVLVLGVAVLYSYAAESKAVERAEAKEARAVAAADTRWDEMMRRSHEAMKKFGVPEGEIMRHDEIAYSRFTSTDPIGLIALQGELKLSAEQIAKIEAVNDKARREAMGVLSGEQIQIVERMKGTPESLSGICEDMSARSGGREVVCPTCARPLPKEEPKESPGLTARVLSEGAK